MKQQAAPRNISHPWELRRKVGTDWSTSKVALSLLRHLQRESGGGGITLYLQFHLCEYSPLFHLQIKLFNNNLFHFNISFASSKMVPLCKFIGNIYSFWITCYSKCFSEFNWHHCNEVSNATDFCCSVSVLVETEVNLVNLCCLLSKSRQEGKAVERLPLIHFLD